MKMITILLALFTFACVEEEPQDLFHETYEATVYLYQPERVKSDSRCTRTFIPTVMEVNSASSYLYIQFDYLVECEEQVFIELSPAPFDWRKEGLAFPPDYDSSPKLMVIGKEITSRIDTYETLERFEIVKGNNLINPKRMLQKIKTGLIDSSETIIFDEYKHLENKACEYNVMTGEIVICVDDPSK
ncbi:MAG: hypothetical protein ACR2MR_13635 [Dietzia maris]